MLYVILSYILFSKRKENASKYKRQKIYIFRKVQVSGMRTGLFCKSVDVLIKESNSP